MIYRNKYLHDNITVNILSYRDNCANDNTVDTISTRSLPAVQCSGCNIKMYSTTWTQCITIVRIIIFLRKKLTFLGINPAVLAQRLVETMRAIE